MYSAVFLLWWCSKNWRRALMPVVLFLNGRTSRGICERSRRWRLNQRSAPGICERMFEAFATRSLKLLELRYPRRHEIEPPARETVNVVPKEFPRLLIPYWANISFFRLSKMGLAQSRGRFFAC